LAEAAVEFSESEVAHHPARSATLVLRLLALMPDLVCAVVAESIALLTYIIARKDVRRIRLNIDAVLGIPFSSLRSRRFAYRCLRHQSFVTMESLASALRPQRLKLRNLAQLAANIEQAEVIGKGFIIATGHLGNWEFVGHSVAISTQRKFFALAKPSRLRWATSLLDQMRRGLGMEVLWTGRRSLIVDMMRQISAGNSLGFVMDQKPDGKLGYDCKFLGFDAKFVGGPAAVVAKSGCPALAVFCIRRGLFEYEIRSELLFVDGNTPKDQNMITEVLKQKIEGAIHSVPWQWLWNYRRWRNEALAK
jgi:lauroyl/myristoyl acyltransferase